MNKRVEELKRGLIEADSFLAGREEGFKVTGRDVAAEASTRVSYGDSQKPSSSPCTIHRIPGRRDQSGTAQKNLGAGVPRFRPWRQPASARYPGISRGIQPYVRTTCPGMSWSVRGPKTMGRSPSTA